jgi:hypothetical protein
LLAERRQRRHPLEKGDIFFEAHAVYPWSFPGRREAANPEPSRTNRSYFWIAGSRLQRIPK